MRKADGASGFMRRIDSEFFGLKAYVKKIFFHLVQLFIALIDIRPLQPPLFLRQKPLAPPPSPPSPLAPEGGELAVGQLEGPRLCRPLGLVVDGFGAIFQFFWLGVLRYGCRIDLAFLILVLFGLGFPLVFGFLAEVPFVVEIVIFRRGSHRCLFRLNLHDPVEFF